MGAPMKRLEPMHFCSACLGDDGPTLPFHRCLGRCKRYDECGRRCECDTDHEPEDDA